MSGNSNETEPFAFNTVEYTTPPSSIPDQVFYSELGCSNFATQSNAHYESQHYQQYNTDAASDVVTHYEQPYADLLAQGAMPQSANHVDSFASNQHALNQDPNPEHIHRHSDQHITYRQDVAIRYLQPPTPPPSGPIIVREIRAPQAAAPPPLVLHQRPPAPVTPPPIIIRERPPLPPPIEPSRVVNKYLPAPPPPPRQVIIKRQQPLPPKPAPIIIEKWLPYKTPSERRVVVQRAEPLVQTSPAKNTIITYDAPSVDVVKNVRHLGTVRVDPRQYAIQYGPNLVSSDYIHSTMTKFGIEHHHAQSVQIPRSSENLLRTIEADIHQEQSIASENFTAAHKHLVHSSSGHGVHVDEYVDDVLLPTDQHSKTLSFHESHIVGEAMHN